MAGIALMRTSGSARASVAGVGVRLPTMGHLAPIAGVALCLSGH